MSLYDRDYHRQPSRFSGPQQRGGFSLLGGRFNRRSAVFWLIVINLAVFLLEAALERFVSSDTAGWIRLWGYFSVGDGVLSGQVWRWVSYQFLHANLSHILYNMLGLFFFGPMVEKVWGKHRFLVFYLLCGLAGPVMYVLLAGVGLLQIPEGVDWSIWEVPMIGASACVFGILAAATRLAPNTVVYVMFVIPAKIRTVVWVLLGIAVYTVVFQGNKSGSNAGGEAAHLGGAAMGFVLSYRPRLLEWCASLCSVAQWKHRWHTRGQKKRMVKQAHDSKRLDDILSKISREGMSSLTRDEREFLQRDTEQRRRP